MTIEKKKEIKSLYFRLPKELWVFLKEKSTREEKPVSEIVISLIEKLRKQDEKKH